MEIDSSQSMMTPVGGLDPIESARLQTPPGSGGALNKDEQLQAAAKQFEGIFLQQILKQMQETMQEASFDPEDSSNGQVDALYCTFLTDAVSQQGGVGLWEKIYDQMKQMSALGGDSQTIDAGV